ncbi:PREDICTED: polygalacturonase At1g48100 [Nicotiana attenuata]|uniref:Polygalacturonase n=1 Tax=Nicotiana attenuata TaxID=49451 RepID=A0A1J6I1E3_NICAT|nr:PREDICTED: polygalacturonase At1g48100 [Nicotiana attenuata]OIS98331.1 polygalacturonase [Nicotiana attenuata]
MKKNYKHSPLIFLLALLLIFFTTFTMVSVEARKHHTKKSKIHHKHRKNGGGNKAPGCSETPSPTPTPAPSHGFYPTEPPIFDILSFGAKGDGVSDDSKALEAAWEAACKVQGATLHIPSEFQFLISPITLQGPCMPNFIFQVDGILLAPSKVGTWPKSSLFQWLNFKWIHNFTIQGTGTFDGQGYNWWKLSQIDYFQEMKTSKSIPDIKPTVLRFYASYNVTVRDIKIMNSPQCHLKFDNSKGVKINNVTISAPESSPNTDGIHLQNSQDVEIHHSNIGTGDDCVSIQTGCSNIHVHHINCGPGHGISLGGLGKDKSVACVSDIIVENVNLESTMYGARIKTWQGGLGSVKNISFSNIQVSDVKVPIMIDQYYCDKHVCKNQTGAVAISNVKFNQIIGTYSAKPIHLACSNSTPCTDVDLIDIQLKPSLNYRGIQQGLCWNSYGKSQAPLLPSSMDYCVRRGSGFVRRISRSHENICS